MANLKSQVGFLPWDIFKPPTTSPPLSQRRRLHFNISPRKTQSEITMLNYFLLIPRLNIEDFWIIGCFQLSAQTFFSMKEDKKVVFL